jgi:hypothetical protein
MPCPDPVLVPAGQGFLVRETTVGYRQPEFTSVQPPGREQP